MVVGATVEEKGFDLSVQVGAVGDLLEDARRLIPSLEEYALVDTSTGLRPGSPDNAPIVGHTDVPGLILATGAYRNGILQAPATSYEVVRLVQEGDEADDRVGLFAPFRPGRFRPSDSRPWPPTDGGHQRVGTPVSRVEVNGAPWDEPSAVTVADLVARWCPSPRGIAVARNGDVVPRSRWARTPLVEGDRIEIVTAVAGG